MDNLGKIHRHYWKEHLKITKTSKFENDLLKTNEDVASQSRKKFDRSLFDWGHKLIAAHHTNVCIFARFNKTYHFHLNFGSFSNFKALFSVVSKDFL